MAETALFSTFEIDIPDQWARSVETGPGESWGSTLSLHPPGVEDVLKLSSFKIPWEVTESRLRNLTNVPYSVPLMWDSWGDLAGFQYDYSEGGQSFRQWWLTSDRVVVIVSYQYDSETDGIDSVVIDAVVRSITSLSPQ
jgi:hypothetical protein